MSEELKDKLIINVKVATTIITIVASVFGFLTSYILLNINSNIKELNDNVSNINKELHQYDTRIKLLEEKVK